MNCEQKSGIFLNMSCTNEATKVCSNCAKKVCKTHHHLLDEKKLCEDCYWEFFLYSEQKKTENTTFIDTDRDRSIIAKTSGNNSNTNEPTNFEGGFGGGEFGGGGASGAWNEGDKQGFNQSDLAATGAAGLFDDTTDSTFFYS